MEGIKKIELTKGYYALVDDEDYEWLNQWKWHSKIYQGKEGGNCWAVRNRRKADSKHLPSQIYMHRVLMESIPSGMEVDHINGKGWDNQKENLRKVTHRTNQQNLHCKKTSKFPGVSWSGNSWRVGINFLGRKYFLGNYTNEVKAYDVYKEATVAIEEGQFKKFIKEHREKRWKKRIQNKTSKYEGVCWHKRDQGWIAQISINGKKKHLGCFEKEEMAYAAYLKAKNKSGV